jgi:hypothetical protein
MNCQLQTPPEVKIKSGRNESARQEQLEQKLLLVIACVVPSLLILSTMIMGEIHSSETSVLTRAPWRHMPEESILHSHSRENLRSHAALTSWAL